MCDLYKNEQKCVDSITKISLEVGMDRRTMKKHIQYLAMMKVNQMSSEETIYELSLILDQDASMAQLMRFNILRQEMLTKAESNLD